MTSFDLAATQTGLLSLIKDRTAPAPCDDAYLQVVAASSQLDVVREIVRWWCTQTLTTMAPFTSRLLVRRGRLDQTIAELSRSPHLSPFRNEQVLQCLDPLRTDPDALLAALAEFESHLLTIAGDPYESPRTTQWPCNPYHVLYALLHRTPLPLYDNGIHFTEVGSAFPGLFRVSTTQRPKV